MATNDNDALLAEAARRGSDRRFFLGSALRGYQQRRRLDDAQLAEWLGCDVRQLTRLRLCRRPDPNANRFRADVQSIAAFAGAQPLHLAALLREVEAYEALHQTGGATALLAARDADEERC